MSVDVWDYYLDSKPPYEALSYTWGDEESACWILLDGLPFHIRPNLRHALRRLRQPRHTRVIWVDAICIDQTGTDEKSVQVLMMGRIYAGARRVVAWLGEETFDSGMGNTSLLELPCRCAYIGAISHVGKRIAGHIADEYIHDHLQRSSIPNYLDSAKSCY